MAKYGVFRCNKCGKTFFSKIKDGKDVWHKCNDICGYSKDVEYLGVL